MAPHRDQLRLGPGDRDVPEVDLTCDPVRGLRRGVVRGHRAQDDDVALTALEGVDRADPDPGLAGPCPGEGLLLGAEGCHHPDRGVLGEPCQQLVHRPPHLVPLGLVAPGPAAAAGRGLAVRYVHPAEHRSRIGRPRRIDRRDLPPDIGEDLQLARVAIAVDHVRDLRMAPVVLVQQQRGLTMLRRRVVRGVHVVGQPVVLQLRGGQARPDPGLPLLLRTDPGNVPELHRVADDQCPFRPEQQRQHRRNRALARLVDHHEVEELRGEFELAHRVGTDGPRLQVCHQIALALLKARAPAQCLESLVHQRPPSHHGLGGHRVGELPRHRRGCVGALQPGMLQCLLVPGQMCRYEFSQRTFGRYGPREVEQQLRHGRAFRGPGRPHGCGLAAAGACECCEGASPAPPAERQPSGTGGFPRALLPAGERSRLLRGPGALQQPHGQRKSGRAQGPLTDQPQQVCLFADPRRGLGPERGRTCTAVAQLTRHGRGAPGR